MDNFLDILSRIKKIIGKTKDKEIAEILGTSEVNFNKWKVRNKIPYEQLTKYCYENNYDLMFILTGKSTNIANDTINSNNLDEKEKSILKAYKKLDEKKQNYYYFKINADALEN